MGEHGAATRGEGNPDAMIIALERVAVHRQDLIGRIIATDPEDAPAADVSSTRLHDNLWVVDDHFGRRGDQCQDVHGGLVVH